MALHWLLRSLHYEVVPLCLTVVTTESGPVPGVVFLQV